MSHDDTPTPAPKRPAGRKGGARARSLARLAAVQALYQIDINAAPVERVVSEFLLGRLQEDVDGIAYGPADKTHFLAVVRGVSGDRAACDDMIQAVLSDAWTVERLEPLVRAVLRAGVYEIAEMKAVPTRVAITEYVDIAHAFFSQREPALVNGVLDKVGHALWPEAFEPSSGGGSESGRTDGKTSAPAAS